MRHVDLRGGDCREVLRAMIAAGEKVHSVVTDPPYYLESIAKRFGKPGAAAAKAGSDGRFTRLSRGFMGVSWDGADADGTRIAQDPEFWALVYDVLLPGGFVLAFSSPRTGHWQACAMELADFIMHPFKGWAYGQGMPKATAVGKIIDKAAGAQREVVAEVPTVRRIRPGADQNKDGSWEKIDDRTYTHQVTAPATATAAEWEGWFYGTQTAKPALEPIYVGQKPFETKTGYANILKHGVGGFNIEACRVPTEENLNGGAYAKQGNRGVSPSLRAGSGMNVPGKTVGTEFVQPLGRWPANLLHDGSPEVVAMFPDAPGQIASSSSSETRKNRNTYGEMRRGTPDQQMDPRGDSGSAARFFNCFPPDGDPLFYHAKANKADRAGSTHPTVKPVALMRWLCRLVTPPGGKVLDPFAGSGTTGQAAMEEGFDCVLIERDPIYLNDIRRRLSLPVVFAPDIMDIIG